MTKELIQTKEQFDRLLKKLDERDLVAFDTETNGKFSQFEIQLAGLNFGWADYGCYIPVAHLDGDQLPIEFVLNALTPFLTDPSKHKIYHNAKYDEKVCKVYGIDVQGVPWDTMLAARLYNENLPHYNLKWLVETFLGYKMRTYEEVVQNLPRKRGEKVDHDFRKVPLEEAVEYAADDVIWTYALYEFFKPELEKQAVWNCYRHIEVPLGRVVRKMEMAGVYIDKRAIEEADRHFPLIMEQLEKEIYAEAGGVFNVGSSKQLGEVLYDKLRISENPILTNKGSYSTSAGTLKNYAARYPVVDKILRRKKVQKTHSTFVEGLQKFIEKDGRVHANFNQVGTDTGRFSSNGPNLQNQQGDTIEDIKIRDFFIPGPGNLFVIADYSQIELRLLAHFSKDKNMLEAFTSDRDFHDETARKVLEIQGTPIGPDEEVTARQRFNAKALNFGIPYGRGDKSVAEQLGVKRRCAYWPTWSPALRKWMFKDPETNKEVEKAKTPCHNCGKCFIEDWYAAFPRVREFQEEVFETARNLGYIRTLSGRKRRLAETINSQDFKTRTHAERQAFNTKFQGSAGDIIKLAMIELQPRLEKVGASILIQVHDELVMEAPKEKIEEVVAIAKETMEHPLNGTNPLILPLSVEPKICERWSEGK